MRQRGSDHDDEDWPTNENIQDEALGAIANHHHHYY